MEEDNMVKSRYGNTLVQRRTNKEVPSLAFGQALATPKRPLGDVPK